MCAVDVQPWERALVCVEKCVSSRFEEKRERERERGKHNLRLLPIATYVGIFEDPMIKPYLIELQFLLKIYHSYFSSIWTVGLSTTRIFLQFGWWDCLLEVCRSVKKFVKSCCLQEVPITINLGCFGNLTVKSSPIALKFLLKFDHLQLVILDDRIWDRSSSLFPGNLWTLAIFSGDEILEFFLINFNLLIFWVIVGDHLRIRKSCIDMLCDWFLWDSLYFCFGISGVFTVPWVFFISIERFSNVNYWCWFILLFSNAYWFLFGLIDCVHGVSILFW